MPPERGAVAGGAYGSGTAFTWACWAGNLALVKWLVAYARVTIKEVRANGDEVLRMSCLRGYLRQARCPVPRVFDSTGIGRNYCLEHEKRGDPRRDQREADRQEGTRFRFLWNRN
jgi:hypothetical protein